MLRPYHLMFTVHISKNASPVYYMPFSQKQHLTDWPLNSSHDICKKPLIGS